MSRRTLSDAQWAQIEHLLPGKVGDRGRSGMDNRLFIDAILWRARGATPWRDLPPELGHWKTVYTRFRRWSRRGVWQCLFKTLSQDPDFEYVLVDATISKVHADATSQNPSRDISSKCTAGQWEGMKRAPSGAPKEVNSISSFR